MRNFIQAVIEKAISQGQIDPDKGTPEVWVYDMGVMLEALLLKHSVDQVIEAINGQGRGGKSYRSVIEAAKKEADLRKKGSDNVG